MTTTNTQTKGKFPSQTVAETNTTRKTPSLRLPAIVIAAAAICAVSCNDSASGDETPAKYETTQNVLRFETLPDGTQTVKEENVQSDLPDPVMRLVERDQDGTNWIKISHDPVPFADGSKDTTGLLREYAYVNLDDNTMMSQERFEATDRQLERTGDTVYWQAASPYAFDGFWSNQAETNKEEALNLHQQMISMFSADTSGQNTADPIRDTTAHGHGAQGDWSTDKPQSQMVHTSGGGHGGYIFYRSYYPYAYHNYASSPAAETHTSSPNAFKSSNAFSSKSPMAKSSEVTPLHPMNRFSTINLFKSRGLSMTSRISPRSTTFHFSPAMRSPTVRGFFSSRGVSFGS